jgi:hypothetical protein
MFFIMCISNFAPIKIKVYLKNEYIHNGCAIHSKMVTKTTVNEVKCDVKFVCVLVCVSLKNDFVSARFETRPIQDCNCLCG